MCSGSQLPRNPVFALHHRASTGHSAPEGSAGAATFLPLLQLSKWSLSRAHQLAGWSSSQPQHWPPFLWGPDLFRGPQPHRDPCEPGRGSPLAWCSPQDITLRHTLTPRPTQGHNAQESPLDTGRAPPRLGRGFLRAAYVDSLRQWPRRRPVQELLFHLLISSRSRAGWGGFESQFQTLPNTQLLRSYLGRPPFPSPTSSPRS